MRLVLHVGNEGICITDANSAGKSPKGLECPGAILSMPGIYRITKESQPYFKKSSCDTPS